MTSGKCRTVSRMDRINVLPITHVWKHTASHSVRTGDLPSDVQVAGGLCHVANEWTFTFTIHETDE
jgi:hypothetical protein